METFRPACIEASVTRCEIAQSAKLLAAFAVAALGSQAAAVEENDFTVKARVGQQERKQKRERKEEREPWLKKEELKVRSVPRGMGRWGGLVGVKPTR